jgi:hypothetical protein
VKEDVVKTGFRGDWKRKARDLQGWCEVVEEVKVLKCPR